VKKQKERDDGRGSGKRGEKEKK